MSRSWLRAWETQPPQHHRRRLEFLSEAVSASISSSISARRLQVRLFKFAKQRCNQFLATAMLA